MILDHSLATTAESGSTLSFASWVSLPVVGTPVTVFVAVTPLALTINSLSIAQADQLVVEISSKVEIEDAPAPGPNRAEQHYSPIARRILRETKTEPFERGAVESMTALVRREFERLHDELVAATLPNRCKESRPPAGKPKIGFARTKKGDNRGPADPSPSRPKQI